MPFNVRSGSYLDNTQCRNTEPNVSSPTIHIAEDNMAYLSQKAMLKCKPCSACVPMQMFLSHFSSSDRTLQHYSVYCLTANRAPANHLHDYPPECRMSLFR